MDRQQALQAKADASPGVAKAIQLASLAAAHTTQRQQGNEDELQMQAAISSQAPAQRYSGAAATKNETGLPDSLKAGIESLSGLSMDSVRVHYNSSQPAQLNALAYAQGTDIHVAPGQERHLPHEAWHVVQQAQGRVKPTKQMKGGVPVNDNLGLEQEADVMGAQALSCTVPSPRTEIRQRMNRTTAIVQGKFQGPRLLDSTNTVDIEYPGHNFSNAESPKASTGCGTKNEIITAGEHKNDGDSNPGSPKDMDRYRDNFSRTGGLVKDKSLTQASTRLHLINHRFEDSSNTQGVASNIFLGTQKANNPKHLHQVENVVLRALGLASQKNTIYETEIEKSILAPDKDNSNNLITYWQGNKPHADAVPDSSLDEVFIAKENGDAASDGIQKLQPPPADDSKAKRKKRDQKDGWVLRSKPTYKQHLWITYSVKVEYSGAPSHINDNIQHERTQNRTLTNTIADQTKENKIDDFSNTAWKDQALASRFVSTVIYYFASYNPTKKYLYTQESHPIDADA